MDGSTMLTRLAEVINAHDWAGLPSLLHEGFVCRLVHTGEEFSRDEWVQFNADYPGFEALTLVDCVGEGARAAGRSHVVGRADGKEVHFEVAHFITVRDGLIAELVEVWTDVNAQPPHRTRPASG